MNTESFSHQKKLRGMGTALAVISFLGLLFWVMMTLAHLFFPSWMLGSVSPEGLTYFERFVGEDAPDPKVTTDEELRNHFESHFAEAKPKLPEGVTEEIYANTMIYFTKLRAGEVIGGFMLTDELLDPEMNDLPDPETDDLSLPNLEWYAAFDDLSGGMTADSTIRELILKDRAFFEAHKGTYRLIGILTGLFFAIVSIVILRMALSWRKGDPFGPGTIRGLRWLGILFLAQYLAGLLAGLSGLFILFPDSGFDIDFTFYSSTFNELLNDCFTGVSGLTSGIVFLTLSWVLDYGRKMKEEQALTI